MHNFQFSQVEMETEIYTLLSYGDEVRIAKMIDISPGMLSQYLSPNDDRKSPIFKAAQIFAAMIEIDEDTGRAALELFNHFVSRSLSGKELSIDRTREKAYREDCEAKLAEASGADLDTCIREKEQEIAAEIEHLEAMRAEKKKQIHGDVFHRAETRRNGGRARA